MGEKRRKVRKNWGGNDGESLKGKEGQGSEEMVGEKIE